MSRGPLFESDYKPQFSGHETFPLRYGWLLKAYVAATPEQPELVPTNNVFNATDAIAKFGVGKNMVASIRHWATMAGVIESSPDNKVIKPTALGDLIFGPEGLDTYLENPNSLWLFHWNLSSNPQKTTWYWFFSHFQHRFFERDQIQKSLYKLAEEQGWQRSSGATIKRDVECFLRTYASKSGDKKSSVEDQLECPLAELSLIKAVGKRDGFQIVRGPKPTLGDGVFVYALCNFWDSFTSANNLSLEAITHEPGSPGRVFALDESSISERLQRIEITTKGKVGWSETAGMKQVTKFGVLSAKEQLILVENDYAIRSSTRAA